MATVLQEVHVTIAVAYEVEEEPFRATGVTWDQIREHAAGSVRSSLVEAGLVADELYASNGPVSSDYISDDDEYGKKRIASRQLTVIAAPEAWTAKEVTK